MSILLNSWHVLLLAALGVVFGGWWLRELMRERQEGLRMYAEGQAKSIREYVDQRLKDQRAALEEKIKNVNQQRVDAVEQVIERVEALEHKR